ncbi:hypothetical protein DFJ74DRAFT_100837 [Hyaloraphidium curvatum]|nr:hypothetical protein DFJ74DRAFT_100837 [Hyaloraphidium curvatum]
MKLLALFLLAAVAAAAAPHASAAPAANNAVVYRRSCSECSDDVGTFCEFNYPGAPENSVACVSYSAGPRELYRRYTPPVCPQGGYVSAIFTGPNYAYVDSESYNGAGSIAVVFSTGSSVVPCNKITGVVPTYQNTGTVGSSVSFRLDLRGVSGGLPSSTLYASDTISFTSAAGGDLIIIGTQLTNIGAYVLSPSTQYALVMYDLQVVGGASTSIWVLKNDATSPSTSVTYAQGFNSASYVKDGATYAGTIALSFGFSF